MTLEAVELSKTLCEEFDNDQSYLELGLSLKSLGMIELIQSETERSIVAYRRALDTLRPLVENDKDINFNLIKESKAFKNKKKPKRKNRDNEDINYVINKTSPRPGAFEQGQQNLHHTPHRISQEDQDAWFSQMQ